MKKYLLLLIPYFCFSQLKTNNINQKPYLNVELSKSIRMLSDRDFYYGEDNATIDFSFTNPFDFPINVCSQVSYIFIDDLKKGIISWDSLHKGEYISDGPDFNYETYAKSCQLEGQMGSYTADFKKINPNDSILLGDIFYHSFPKESIKPGRYKVILRMPTEKMGYVEKDFIIIIKDYKQSDYSKYKEVLNKVNKLGYSSIKNHPMIDFIYNDTNNVYYHEACEKMCLSGGGVLASTNKSSLEITQNIKLISKELYKDFKTLKIIFNNASPRGKRDLLYAISSRINDSKYQLYGTNENDRINNNNNILKLLENFDPIYSEGYINNSCNKEPKNNNKLINYSEKKCKNKIKRTLNYSN